MMCLILMGLPSSPFLISSSNTLVNHRKVLPQYLCDPNAGLIVVKASLRSVINDTHDYISVSYYF